MASMEAGVWDMGLRGSERADRCSMTLRAIKHQRGRGRKPTCPKRLPTASCRAGRWHSSPGSARRIGDASPVVMPHPHRMAAMRLKVALDALRADPAFWRRMWPWLVLSLLVLVATFVIADHEVRFTRVPGELLTNPTFSAAKDGNAFADWEIRGAPRLVDGTLVLDNDDHSEDRRRHAAHDGPAGRPELLSRGRGRLPERGAGAAPGLPARDGLASRPHRLRRQGLCRPLQALLGLRDTGAAALRRSLRLSRADQDPLDLGSFPTRPAR